MDDSNGSNVLRKYTLVRFIHRGNKRKIEEIDIVPTAWLLPDKTNNKKSRCMTSFIDSIDNEEDKKLLHELVESDSPAPEEWPLFRVEVVGRAGIFFAIP